MAEEASGDEEEKLDSWSELPSEVLSLIFSHLFSKQDHFIFCAVCKSWKSVMAFRTPRPLPFDFSYRRSPFLMALKGDRYNLFHPTHSSYYLHIPELSNKIILDSKYGWLLMAGIGNELLSIFFYHPLTKEKIGLPDLPSDYYAFLFGFYSLPISPECVVVAIEARGCVYLTIIIIKLGDEDWTEVHLYYDHKRFRYGSRRFFVCCTPVFHDGKCYCLDEDGKVVVFDPNDVEDSWEFCGNPCSKVPHMSVVQSFMVESDGELLTVFLGNEGEIWIYKLNPITGEWMMVKDLGDKVLYLSNGASWAERAVFEGMGNRIYLPMLCNNSNNTIVFYSLTTGKFHSNGHDFSRKDVLKMKQLCHSTWIEPW